METELDLEIVKGGEGSGSWEGPGDPRFAHEGGGTSLYHGTTKRMAEKILKEGLRIDRSTYVNRIFATPDKRLALSYAATRTLNARGRSEDKYVPLKDRDVALVYVNSSGFSQRETSAAGGIDLERVRSTDVPASGIYKVELYKYRDLVSEDGKLVADLPSPHKVVIKKARSYVIVPLDWDAILEYGRATSSGEGGSEGGGQETIVDVFDKDTGETFKGYKDSDGFTRNYDKMVVYWGGAVNPKDLGDFKGGDTGVLNASSSGKNHYVTPDFETVAGYAEIASDKTGKTARVYSFEINKGEAWLPYSGPHKKDGFELAANILKERIVPHAFRMRGEWVEHNLPKNRILIL